MEWYEILTNVLSGLVLTIPLVVALIKYIKQAIQEKNWNALVQLVTNLMKEAETKFDNGADRREWVLIMVQASAETINYEIDIDEVGNLIDVLCDMSRVVNFPVEEDGEDAAK